MNTLAAVIFLCIVHLSMGFFSRFNQARILSFGGGVAIAFIFVDLLPKLCLNDQIVVNAGILPFLERHVYILALTGFLVSYMVEKKRSESFSFLSYLIFNFMIGYAIADKNDPDVRPLVLFSVAIGLHTFTTDFAMREKHPKKYQNWIRWAAVFSLLAGWTLNLWISLPETAVALMAAYIAGGVILNVTKHELPSDKPNDPGSFLTGTVVYTLLILLQLNPLARNLFNF